MGVGTIDSLLNGRLPVQDWYKSAFTGQAVGGYHSPLYVSGLPGAGSAPSAGTGGAALTSGRSGTIPFPAAVANRGVYLNSADIVAASGVGSAFLIDRLWENSGLNVTIATLQAISPVALPPRDINGSTFGAGVGIAIEVVTATGNGAPVNATVTYTDSDGNTGATGTVAIPATAVAGTWLPVPLATGDVGARAITGFQLASTLTSGALSLVMYRRLGRTLRCLTANVGDSFGPADGGAPMYDSSCPQWIYILSATSVGVSSGTVGFVQA